MNQPGQYSATKTKIVTTESGAKKTPAMAIGFNVTHLWDGKEWQAVAAPFERTTFLYLSDGAWPYTADKLADLQFNGDFQNPQIGDDPFTVECRHEQYEGKTREKWELTGGGKFEAEPAPSEVARRFSAKWRNERGAPKAPPPGKPASPPAKAPTTEADSVPF